MKNDWQNLPDSEEDAMIEDLRNDLRDLARLIRHCQHGCSEGEHVTVEMRDGREYEFARKCSCFKAFRAKGRELLKAVKAWERMNSMEYHNLITPEMTYHARPSGEPASAETAERARRAIQRIPDLGAECEGLRNQEAGGQTECAG